MQKKIAFRGAICYAMAGNVIPGMGPGKDRDESMAFLDQLLLLLTQLVELAQVLNIIIELLRLLGLAV